MLKSQLSAAFVLLACQLQGCGTASPPVQDPQMPQSPPRPEVMWVERDIEHEGTTISLGYRGETSPQPVASITRGGKPVAGAMVFCALVSSEQGSTADEIATIYEPGDANEPGLYVTSKPLADAVSGRRVRFRIVLADSEQDWVREVEIPLK